MKRFLIKVLLYSLPLIIGFGFPVSVLFITGENFRELDSIVEEGDDYLIGFAYFEDNYKYLKQTELENRASVTVSALGTSRVLKFRDKMFSKPFYNSGYTVSKIYDFAPFIENNLKDKNLEILILGLDQWMFNENCHDLLDYDKTNLEWSAQFESKPPSSSLYNVWKDVYKGKYGLEILFSNLNNEKTKLGLNAIVNNKGFRKDGSMLYGNQIVKLINKDTTANDYNFSDSFSRIENGERGFEYGIDVNPRSLDVLNDLLDYCKNHNIFIVGVLPPFADGVNNKMKESEKFYYMDSIYSKALPVFEKYGFELWDNTHLNKFNSNDSEIIDGFHAGEVAYLKMLIHMIENNSKLKEYTNLSQLKNQLENRINNYTVY